MDVLYNCAHPAGKTVVMKQDLSASIVFSSMTVFDIIRGQLHMISNTLTVVIKGKVSLDRVNEFLHKVSLFLTPLA